VLCFLKDAWGSWWQTEWKRTLAFPFLAPNPHPTTCVLLQVRCPRSALWSRISSDGKFVCGLSESDSDYLDHRVEVFFLCFFGEGCWQTSCYSWNYGGRGNIFFIYPDGYDDGTAMWIHPWDGTWIWRFTKPWQMSYFSVNLSWPVFLGSGRRNQIHPPWFDRSLILYRCMNLICFFLRIACRCVHMRLEIVTSLCIGPLTNRLAVQMGHLLRVLDSKQASSSMRLEKNRYLWLSIIPSRPTKLSECLAGCGASRAHLSDVPLLDSVFVVSAQRMDLVTRSQPSCATGIKIDWIWVEATACWTRSIGNLEHGRLLSVEHPQTGLPRSR